MGIKNFKNFIFYFFFDFGIYWDVEGIITPSPPLASPDGACPPGPRYLDLNIKRFEANAVTPQQTLRTVTTDSYIPNKDNKLCLTIK